MTPRTAIVAGFATILAVVIATDLLARRPRSAFRPLGVVLAAALRTRAARLAVLVAWLWVGWHFLAR